MGISIKNDEVERLVRAYAESSNLGVTQAVEKAVRIASAVERVERSERIRREAFDRFREISEMGWSSDDRSWSRDDLHER